jgi:hypothetical protein
MDLEVTRDRTRDGKVAYQIVGVGCFEPFGEVDADEFTADCWSHVEAFEMVQSTAELEGLLVLRFN